MATCYRHPSRETGVACSNCGRPICPDCMTPTSVGMRCPECARERTRVHSLRTGASEPVVTYALIAICFVAWLLEGSVGNATRVFADGALYGPGISGSGAPALVSVHGPLLISVGHDYWRLITGGFLHATGTQGILHIGFNMYLLWILGRMLEPVLGSVRFGVIYFTALLAGSFGSLLLSPDAVTVGASGAVFGLMGAAAVDLHARGVNPFQTGIGGLIVINLIFSFTFSNISIGGHIGGLIGGALAALAFQQADRRRLREAGFAACAVLAAAAAAGAIAVA
jgi:membrane associated rhomboid family serine protease